MRKTVRDIQEMKWRGEKITMLTCYDSSFAKLLNQTIVDCILVGDSIGNTILGYDTTLPVEVDDIIRACSAIIRTNPQALVIADMPYMSYHNSITQAVDNAGKLIRYGGAGAIKLEGGQQFAEVVRAITRAQIPVVGHLGLTPQSVNIFGGYQIQATSVESADKLIDDAKFLQDSGAIMLVVEGVPSAVGQQVTNALEIPVIGIGAGNQADGQVLVLQDMLGMTPKVPKFVKQYANLGTATIQAINTYCHEVKANTFPDDNFSY